MAPVERPAIVVGLTGGIGSGKSTVSAGLDARGAVLVDADEITRELQRPGQPVLDAMKARFGDGIVKADGTLDRAAVAELVFGDTGALADLNAIVHPAVNDEIDRRAAQADPGDIVVIDIPLLAEGRARRGGRGRRFAGVIVVDAPVAVAVDRLVAHRGFAEADARARIATQASRRDRVALADLVIDNGGSVAELERQLDRAWVWVHRLAARSPTESAEDHL